MRKVKPHFPIQEKWNQVFQVLSQFCRVCLSLQLTNFLFILHLLCHSVSLLLSLSFFFQGLSEVFHCRDAKEAEAKWVYVVDKYVTKAEPATYLAKEVYAIRHKFWNCYTFDHLTFGMRSTQRVEGWHAVLFTPPLGSFVLCVVSYVFVFLAVFCSAFQ